jgi:hypothetical protein
MKSAHKGYTTQGQGVKPELGSSSTSYSSKQGGEDNV